MTHPLILLFLLLAIVGQPVEASPNGARRFGKPNIIVILADDLGYGELGCQGNPQIPTPHIDSLAQQGVRFTAAYVTGPNCSPSRAGLLVGKFPTRFGHEFNPIGAQNENPKYGLPKGETTLADRLQKAGYVTGIIGKWHLGGAAIYHPYRRGFDEFFGFTHEGHFFVPAPWHGVTTMLRRTTLPGGGTGRRTFGKVIYGTHMGYDEPDYDANNPIVRGSQPVTETNYLTDAWSREAVDFIHRHRDKPFFLFVAHNAVHSPLQAADAYMRKFEQINDLQRRIFAAMLANLDNSVGKVCRAVEAAGLQQDTLIFFLSDNGGPTRELTSSNLPLRGEKGQMFEGGIRVPFLMAWPGKLPSGTVYHSPVSSVDISATALAAAKSPNQDVGDGVDLLPFVVGNSDQRPHQTLYWRQGRNAALRHGDWKIVRQRSAQWQLFNLSQDQSETRDESSNDPDKLSELISIWQQLDGEMVPPAFR